MPILPGRRLGPYEILSAIGAGGMGEVYKAHDTRLNRDVALKVIPEGFAADADRMARFEREAKLLASLNHPHIASIYGLEESSSTNALVMELVEGPTLADRIAAGPIPLDEALPIAKQIAEALEYAHDHGVIHRDLKPANIKVKPDGTVKVLDFGLAKAMLDEPTAVDMNNSPTLSMAATMAGTILGTAAYMSPEQARGKTVDRRTDIWAFGVVLFEMLTGHAVFAGEDVSETLAFVMTKEPPFEALPPKTLPAIQNLLRRCLERNLKRRLQHIGEARIVIEDVLSGTIGAESIATAGAGQRQHMSGWFVAAVLLLALATLSFIHFRGTPPQRTARFQIPLPDKNSTAIFQLSPDGRVLAFSAIEGSRGHLWVRPIDSLVAQALPGTEDASYPFWSPDSTYIGYFVPGKLKKIALAGGPPQTICDAPDGRGGTWNSDGMIVFSPGPGSAIARVSAAGGVPTALTKLATPDELHRFPMFLPDGRHFLYLASLGKPETSGINVGSLDGAPPVRILSDESSAAYAPSEADGGDGLVLFRREGTLMAVPFDPRRLRTTGEVFPIAENVGVYGNANAAAFSVSRNGVLAYSTGELLGGTQIREIAWVDRSGKRLGVLGQPEKISSMTLSPNEKRILFGLFNVGGDTADIWLLDVERDVPSCFTFRPGLSGSGIWSPDGSATVFAFNNRAIYRKAADGTGNEELVLTGGINTRPMDWSQDGKFVVYQSYGGATGTDLWLLPLQGDRKPFPYLQTPFNEGTAQFSPDGRWMAYVSNESGQPQVYVQAIPASGAKWQISPTGGDQPRWRHDGRELFFISADRKLTAVSVKSDTAFESGTPQSLFGLDPVFAPFNGHWAYQPSADGQRFLILANVSGSVAPPITIVFNFQAGLKK